MYIHEYHAALNTWTDFDFAKSIFFSSCLNDEKWHLIMVMRFVCVQMSFSMPIQRALISFKISNYFRWCKRLSVFAYFILYLATFDFVIEIRIRHIGRSLPITSSRRHCNGAGITASCICIELLIFLYISWLLRRVPNLVQCGVLIARFFEVRELDAIFCTTRLLFKRDSMIFLLCLRMCRSVNRTTFS